MLQTLSCRMDIAAAYGADAAIFMNNIVFWTLKNKAENRHYHEGRYWTYGTVAGFAKLYPLWSEPQLKRIISRCREAGILLMGDFNDDRRNRTGWYSPSDEILALYGDGIEDLCIVRKRKMQSTKSSHEEYEIGKCNKVQVATQVDNIPLTPPRGAGRQKAKRTPKEAPDWKPERFAAFWDYYSHRARGENKQGAIRAWDRLRPSDELIEEMGRALVRQVSTDEWQRGVGIPYASTWLNNARWKDRPKAAGGGDAERPGRGSWAPDPEVF